MFDFFPTNRGFESFFGYLTDQEHYYNHTYPFKISEKWWTDMVESTPSNYTLVMNSAGELSTILYRNKVRDLIKEHNKEHPFFL